MWRLHHNFIIRHYINKLPLSTRGLFRTFMRLNLICTLKVIRCKFKLNELTGFKKVIKPLLLLNKNKPFYFSDKFSIIKGLQGEISIITLIESFNILLC